MNTEQNKQLVQKVNEAFMENNMEKVLSYFAEDVRWTMVGQGTWAGKEAIRKGMKDVEMGQGPAPTFSIDVVIAEGDRVACRGSMHMAKADGSDWNGHYCDMYQIRDGKVVELMAFVIENANDQPAA